MTHTFAKAKDIDPHGGYVVRRPRVLDGIGMTLRSAFGNEDAVPTDIERCIEVLDAIPSRH